MPYAMRRAPPSMPPPWQGEVSCSRRHTGFNSQEGERLRRTLLIWSALAAAALAAFAFALATGSTRLPLPELVRALASPGDSVAGEIVTQLRLPRALAAFSVGGLLALAG